MFGVVGESPMESPSHQTIKERMATSKDTVELLEDVPASTDKTGSLPSDQEILAPLLPPPDFSILIPLSTPTSDATAAATAQGVVTLDTGKDASTLSSTSACNPSSVLLQEEKLSDIPPPPLSRNDSTQNDESKTKHLCVQPHQWLLLTQFGASGKTKLEELLFPFSANPNVKITAILEKSHIEFVGKEDAVDSAYQYFENQLPSDKHDQSIIVQYVNASSGVIATMQSEMQTQIRKIEQDNSVKVSFNKSKRGTNVSVKGNKDNVFKAKSKLFKLVNSLKQKQEQTKNGLKCSPAISAYIHHVLFEREMSAVHEVLLSSLGAVKVTSERNSVVLSGPSASLAEGERKLIAGVVPDTLKHSEFKFSCSQKFVPQIHQFFARLHEKYDFVHLVSYSRIAMETRGGAKRRPSSGGARRRDSSDSEDGFTIFIFSTNSNDFSEVDSHAKELNPGTGRFQISAKSADYVGKRKNELERNHCVRVFISNRSDPVSVTLHGLNERDIAQCREDIEQSIFVTHKFQLTPQQLLYLRNHCQESLKELEGKCQRLSLPPAHSKGNNPFVSVVGKTADVEAVSKELDQMVAKIATDYKEEMFVLKCPQCFFSHWKQRWSERAKSCKETLHVTVEFNQGEGPRKGVYEDVLVNFKVSGGNRDVDEAVETIKQLENGCSVQTEIELPSSQQGRIILPILLKEAQINHMKVWLRAPRGNKLIILAPSFAEKDLETAKGKLIKHFENNETKTESIPCDRLTFDLLIANHTEYLESVNETGKRNCVKIKLFRSKQTITLEGSASGIEIVRPCVENALKNIKKTIDTHHMHVKAIQAPYLKTKGFKDLCVEIKKNKCVDVTMETGNIVVHQVQMSQHVQLSIVRGDILLESVDGIVNAANEDLDHIGGLAKAISDAAGPEVQRESRLHVAMKGRVLTGQAVCLGAGNLSCMNIIHAVAPRYNAFIPNVRDKLYNAVTNSLMVSQRAGHSSIAIPALGAGIFAVPIDICASASLQAVQDFANQSRSSCMLTDIRFVLDSPAACEAFMRATKRYSSSTYVSTIQHAVSSRLQQDYSVNQQQWMWLNDSRQYQAYDARTCMVLSAAYSRDLGSCLITVNATRYTVDFANMEQTNTMTNHTRKIALNPIAAVSSDDTDSPGAAAVQWYYKGDSQQWEPYLPRDSSQLEQWYNSRHTAATLLIGKHTYQFDFDGMNQINVKTKTSRQIKRSAGGNIAGDSTAQWFFQNDLTQFQQYSAQDSSQLEEWYQSGSMDGRLTMFGSVYSFDFNGMKQTNIATGKVRTIKREGEELEERSVTKTGAVIKLRGNRNNIDNVQQLLELKLQKCLVTESEKLPKSVEFSSIQRVARRHTVECSLTKAQGNTPAMVKITGVQFVVQKCITDIKSAIISNLENAPTDIATSVECPKEWQRQKETVQVFPVPSGSGEWTTVAAQFNLTMSTSTIVSIERIQNKYVWRKYAQHRAMLHEKNKGVVNEKKLFHGTRKNPPKEIYGSDEGFDMRFCTSGMWGQANYFAVNASYSDTYSYSAPTGDQQMFLVYVLTGDSHTCSSNSSLRMPPKKDSYATAAGENLDVRYDTVTGNTNGSDVYMTYDNLKAYPAYLITYRRPVKRFGFF